jgi:hypothetical protein
MKPVIVLCLLTALSGIGYCQPPEEGTPAENNALKNNLPDGPDEKVDRLLKAAAHLEAAGELEEARRIRALAGKETAALLARLKALEAEVRELRERTGALTQVRVQVRLLEVSRTKLRKLGVDLSHLEGNRVEKVLVGNGCCRGGTQIVRPGAQILQVVEALRKDGLARVLAEPTLVAVSGRPAMLRCGGEFPASVPPPDGSEPLHYKEYGTEVSILPRVLDDGQIRLEMRLKISELDDPARVPPGQDSFPRLNVRQTNTSVEMRSGETIVCGGLIHNRVAAQHGGARQPQKASERHMEGEKEEVELLVLVTPEIVGAETETAAQSPAPPRDTLRPAGKAAAAPAADATPHPTRVRAATLPPGFNIFETPR